MPTVRIDVPACTVIVCFRGLRVIYGSRTGSIGEMQTGHAEAILGTTIQVYFVWTIMLNVVVSFLGFKDVTMIQ